MESAARTHWRAAAWLLERSDPERYGRRPISSASLQQVEAALKFVTEAALKAAAPDRQNETYDQVRAACDHAFKCLFPNIGPWGSAKNPKLPPTPLADQQEFRQVDDYARAHIVPDLDEAGNALPIILPKPPAPPTAEELAQAQAKAEERARLKELLRQQREAEEAAARINAAAGGIADDDARERILSPKIDFATEFHPPRRDLGLLLGYFERPPQPAESSEGKNGILSPKTSFATEFNGDDPYPVQRVAPVAAPTATGAAQPQEATLV